MALQASETIMASHPDARILLLTTFSDDEYIIKALSIGAKGYILKQNFESIAPAVKAVYNGQTVFGDEIVGNSLILLDIWTLPHQMSSHRHLPEWNTNSVPRK